MKDTILRRKSVRTYKQEPLSEKDLALILEYCHKAENMIGPLGTTIRMEIIHTADKEIHGKIGTYGIIKNAPSYLLIITQNTKNAMFDLGFVVEKLVLFLEKNHIGSCWLGGTYNLKNFDGNLTISQDEFMPIILPVGYSAENLSITEKIMRRLAKADKRIESSKLFFDTNFTQPLTDQFQLDDLEYVRQAPSASNKQPWRLLITNNSTHFYIDRTPGYSKNLRYDIQILDIGIAFAHYTILHPNYHISQDNPGFDTALEYVITAVND